jgi:hypothetical protein
MSAPAIPDESAAGSAPAAPPSRRHLLARLTVDAARSVAGVAGLAESPTLWAGDERFDGISVMPSPEGERFDVELAIRAELVDLRDLGDRVRQAVATAAQRAGEPSSWLGDVSVLVVDVVAPQEGAA